MRNPSRQTSLNVGAYVLAGEINRNVDGLAQALANRDATLSPSGPFEHLGDAMPTASVSTTRIALP